MEINRSYDLRLNLGEVRLLREALAILAHRIPDDQAALRLKSDGGSRHVSNQTAARATSRITSAMLGVTIYIKEVTE
jgi:hypothetical protein